MISTQHVSGITKACTALIAGLVFSSPAFAMKIIDCINQDRTLGVRFAIPEGNDSATANAGMVVTLKRPDSNMFNSIPAIGQEIYFTQITQSDDRTSKIYRGAVGGIVSLRRSVEVITVPTDRDVVNENPRTVNEINPVMFHAAFINFKINMAAGSTVAYKVNCKDVSKIFETGSIPPLRK